MQTKIPKKIDRYAVKRVIGRGAMGLVVLAFDPIIERPVAIKLLRHVYGLNEEDYEEFLKRFFREAKAIGRLTHPNIVQVYDAGVHEQLPFIVMEFVEGETLHKILSAGFPLTWSESTRIVRDIAVALDYAHRAGVIHRDIKPSNIIILYEGSVKLLDFGVARMTRLESTSEDKEGLVGTPSYMAPEILKNEPARPESDLFSLGVVFYQLLTGKKPFEGKTLPEVIQAILYQNPVPPIQINPEIPPFLNTIVMRLIQKDPARRYQNANALVSDLNRLLENAKTIKLDIAQRIQEFVEAEKALEEEQTMEDVDPPVTLKLRIQWARMDPRMKIGLISGIMVLLVIIGFLGFRKSGQAPAVDQKTPVAVQQTEKKKKKPQTSLPQTSRNEQIENQRVVKLYQLGKNYCLNKLYKKCERVLKKVLEIDPNYQPAQKLLQEVEQRLYPVKDQSGTDDKNTPIQ